MSELRKILLKKKGSCKSVWFMRQAGRYLPEFRKIRKKNKDFVKLCFNSDLCAELTLQPIKRFDLDSAIIFSDILLVPYALGQELHFTKNFGPKLSKFSSLSFFKNNKKKFSEKLTPVYKAIEISRKKLVKGKSLISFIGAPWTLIVYMLNLKENKLNINKTKLEKNASKINRILEELISYLCVHIKNQINAGADVVQIFDSWAGLIPSNKIKEFCFIPNKKIIEFCKKNKIPNICFPKGIKNKYYDFNNIVKPDGLNIDSDIDPNWARKKLKNVVLQGGLDPKILLKADEIVFKEAIKYFEIFKDIPYVFNLGHGLLPETDPDKVDKLIKLYRNFDGQ